MTKKAILRNELFVPEKSVTKEMIKDFTATLSYETNEDGIEIPIQEPLYKYYKAKHIYGFYSGNKQMLNKHFSDFDITDERVCPKMSRYARNNLRIKDSFKLKPSQKEMISDWLEKKNGIIMAPARTGKTVVMGYIVNKLKKKTLILTNQVELSKQWLKEFSNVVTNVDDIANEKRPIIGILKKFSDIDKYKYDIVISTWQKWHTNKQCLRKYRKYFGLILVDEIHRCNANCPKKVIDNFWAKHRGGVTATVTRKDGREVFMRFIVGKVTAKGTPKQMMCKVCKVNTDMQAPSITSWTRYINSLCLNERRNAMIIKLATKLALEGKHIVIGSDRTSQILYLTKMLNKNGIACSAFYSKVHDRNGILDKAKSGKYKVIVANRSMLTGINVPIWDTYFNILPINNPPSYYQQFSRIRTLHKDKKEAIIYDFVDIGNVDIGLFNNRKKQYEKEGFMFIPSLSGFNLASSKDIERGIVRQERNEWDNIKAARSKARPFFSKANREIANLFD